MPHWVHEEEEKKSLKKNCEATGIKIFLCKITDLQE